MRRGALAQDQPQNNTTRSDAEHQHAACFVQTVDPEPVTEVRQWPMAQAAMLLGTTDFSFGR